MAVNFEDFSAQLIVHRLYEANGKPVPVPTTKYLPESSVPASPASQDLDDSDEDMSEDSEGSDRSLIASESRGDIGKTGENDISMVSESPSTSSPISSMQC